MRVVRSCRLAFFPADAALAISEVSPDSIAAPIAKVAYQYYSLLTRLTSWVFDCSRNWMEESFIA